MRLLNTSTLEVEEFLQSQVPEYVILSHTWREEEVTLHDLLSGAASSKKGFAKITSCCKKAKDDGFKYCWIDTCCIDKTSSAELSEAINSMYQWYKDACICYAYLEDLYESPPLSLRMFSQSRWFKRGWTLQELIVPKTVEFYNASWVDIGTRSSLQQQLTSITNINKDILNGGDPHQCSVGVRMSWAGGRETSRLEDKAYCLLGLFGVNMPLLYGEGERAFIRLQEEILRINEDYTLFVWDTNRSYHGLLAHAPSNFGTFMPRRGPVPDNLGNDDRISLREDLSTTCFSLLPPPKNYSPPRLTSRGIQLTLPLSSHEEGTCYGLLTLMKSPKGDTLLLCVMLSQIYEEGNQYERNCNQQSTLVLLPRSALGEFRYTFVYLSTSTNYREEKYPLSSGCGNPSMVRIRLDPALLSDVAYISSSWVNVRTFCEQQPDFESLPMFASTTRELCDSRSLPAGISVHEARRIARYLHKKDMNTAKIAANVPDLCFIPWSEVWTGGHSFRFQFVSRVGLDLLIVFSPTKELDPFGGILPNLAPPCAPWLVARTEPTSSVLKHWICEDLSEASDRASVQMTYGEEPGWYIKMSIRRAGCMAFAPGSKQYVLELTKERKRN